MIEYTRGSSSSGGTCAEFRRDNPDKCGDGAVAARREMDAEIIKSMQV